MRCFSHYDKRITFVKIRVKLIYLFFEIFLKQNKTLDWISISGHRSIFGEGDRPLNAYPSFLSSCLPSLPPFFLSSSSFPFLICWAQKGLCRLRAFETWSLLSFSFSQQDTHLGSHSTLWQNICNFNCFQIKSLELSLFIIKM